MKHIERRLMELEATIASRKRRLFVAWDKSSYDPGFVLDDEIARLEQEEGMSEDDELFIVSWQVVDPVGPRRRRGRSSLLSPAPCCNRAYLGRRRPDPIHD